MERTQAVDRLVDVLSPVLAEELERLTQETQRQLEGDFQKRMAAAVRDMEAATQLLAYEQQEQAVAAAKEMVRKQVTEELQATFDAKLFQSSEELCMQFAQERQQLQKSHDDERTRLQTQLDQWKVFAEAQHLLAESTSQAEILARFLKLTEPFAESIALYVAKPDGLALWKSRGKTFPELVSQDTIDPEYYFKPVSVRGKVVVAVCAVQLQNPEAIDFLVACLERTIEIFGLKLHAPPPPPVTIGHAASVSSMDAVAAPASVVEATPVDDKAHAEARRSARLLVSEIKLYHDQELREARVTGDIYSRLRQPIEKAREQYRQGIQAGVLTARDYFHDELVRVLADGNAAILGEAYPGPLSS